MDIYEYFDICKENGMSGEEAIREYQRELAEYEEERLEELEERSLMYAYQQDLIDIRRFER